MNAESFQHIAPTLPSAPGIYKYYDLKGELLYIGKAKNLKKRISSYFTKNNANRKTQELVRRIQKINFTIVDSEQDALFLENSLIKKHQPKYNIELKDDKTYPFIVIKKEAFPRIFLTRRKIADGSEYLGPFTSVGRVRELLEFIKTTIPLRTCKLNLSDANIRSGKYKVCLEYHLGNCKGPCEGLQSKEDYEQGLLQIRDVLKGNLNPLIQQFKKEMQEAATAMGFEKAEIYKQKIAHLEQYRARSVIVNSRQLHADVFSMIRSGTLAYVNYLMVHEGAIIQTHTITLEPQLDETDEEILSFAISNLRATFNSLAREIIVPIDIEYPMAGIEITVPKSGDKKKLLELSETNANYFMGIMKRKQILKLEGKDDQAIKRTLYDLQEALHMPHAPLHIECFDNSNFHGSFPVSAMVCFKNGAPSKKDYRHFNVKTVEGINDFATMKEVVFRRYERLKLENSPLPDLVVIDGGKGQLSAAMESIDALGLRGQMTVVGLAKNEEEIFFPGDQESLKLPFNSDPLKLIRRIRDEVHRFGITFHRSQRSKGTFKNELEGIKGIGAQTITQLMQTFRSVKKIKGLSEEELTEAVGPAKAKLLRDYFEGNAIAEEG